MSKLHNLWKAEVSGQTPFIITTAIYQPEFNKPKDTPTGALAVLMKRFEPESELDKLHKKAIMKANIFLDSATLSFKGKDLKVSRWKGGW